MELEEQSGFDTCKVDSEKICWPLVQPGGGYAEGVQSLLEGERLLQVGRLFMLVGEIFQAGGEVWF